jgi:hypothetical protein
VTSVHAKTFEARWIVLALIAYSAVTVWFTWPLVLSPGSVIPSDVGDPVLNTWILWWNAFHWPLTETWWNAPIFFPADHALAFSEHLMGLTPIAAPIIRASGNPLLGYNISFLLTYALSATSAYLLAFALTERRDAAFLAGLAFGFAPYRVAQWSHLQVLVAYWLPLALLGLHRFARTGRRSWLILFVAAFVMQSLSNGYYLAYFSVLVGIWLLWFLVRPGSWTRLAAVVVAWLAGIAAMLPILLTYREVHAQYGLTRNLDNMRLYSADVAGWLSASPNLWLWSRLPSYGTAEGMLFTGFTVMALVLVGVVVSIGRRTGPARQPSRSEFAFYAIAAVALYALALGPSLTFLGERLAVPGPYAWLAAIPGFSSLRVPARFGMLVMLCVATSAAIGYSLLSEMWSARWRFAAAIVLASAITAESLPKALPLWEPPRLWELDVRDDAGPLLVLPMLNELNEAASMYRSMFHHRPLVNGYSGHIPPWYLALKEALDNRDPAVLDELAHAGVTNVAVVTRNDSDGSWREYVRTRGELARESTDGTFTLFRLGAAEKPTRLGSSLPIASIHASTHAEIAQTMLDDRVETWWSTITPQSGGEELILDLGSAQLVAGVQMECGRAGFEFPRELEIDVSTDSAEWTGVWHGPTAGLSVGASMHDPVRPRLSISFDERTVRFVRLRQLGRHRSSPWTVSAIRVVGPATPGR